MTLCGPCRRGPGRPPAMSHEEREARILSAAEQVLADRGLSGATMSGIARAAGMSKRTVYEIFADRDALLAALIRRLHDRVTRPLTEAQRDLPLDKRLRILMRIDLSTDPGPHKGEVIRAVIAEARRNPEIAALYLREGPDRARAMVAEELSRAVARGEIALQDVEFAARLALDMAHGAVLDWLLHPPPCEATLEAKRAMLDRRLDCAVEVFVKGADGTI